MGLTEYRRKRDFKVTSEPRGAAVKRHSTLSFVIQKHAASHLHYDFRLELDGVLKSWAVPKGPSLDPATKRLAMQVEDHPLEYGNFEGIIPAGEYGGGTVLLWDRGTWEPVSDADRGYRDGSLKFILHGEKLQGGWMLVRKGGRRSGPDERHWFLFKERDEFADPDKDLTAELPLSVTTDRDLDEIAAQATREWGPNGEVRKVRGRKRPQSKQGSKTAASPRRRNVRPRKVRAARQTSGRKPALTATDKKAMAKKLKTLSSEETPPPKSVEVQLATLTKDAPAGDDWIHEIKFDGYRMLCRVEEGETRFISRNGHDWTSKFPDLATAVSRLPVKSVILDGEVVVLEPNGTTSFQALQRAFKTPGSADFLFYVFDLLYLDGHDIREAPIEERKDILGHLIGKSAAGPIRFSDHVVGDGPKFFAEAARLHLEGIISKRRGQPYSPGRSLDWLKIKSSMREEFVIGGYTKPTKSRTHFGALSLGYFDRAGHLIYSGRVGTGFDQQSLADLYDRFQKLVQPESPFKNLSGTTGQARGVTWLKPKLVAQIQFSNWTEDRQLRHPSFQGLREDKAAQEVVRADPVSLPETIDSQETANMPKRAARQSKIASRTSASHLATSEVAGVHLSHPDKVLYPEQGITKLDLARYYEQVAEWMLPHAGNRLLSLVRCPEGNEKQCFFQKHPGAGTSVHLRRVEVEEKSKTEEYLVLDDAAGLISLVQMGVLEIHVWGSRADDFEKPDRLIFDLDPDPAVKWPQVVAAAKEVRLLLKELGLVAFLKTTGGKGLHIVVPIKRRTSWPEAKKFCRAVADVMVAAAPDRYIATMSKAARKGKIFVDYLRNDRGATAIAPYSTRARSGAPVSVPISWQELSKDLKSDHFTIRNLPARLSRLRKDPWAEISEVEQSITSAMLKRLKQV